MVDLKGGGFSSKRTFRLWDLAVSHSQLLLRSPRIDEDPSSRNVDLVFTGVFYLDLVDTLRGLEVENPSSEELVRLEATAGVSAGPGHRFYVLSSAGRRRYVGAASLRVEENELPPMSTSLGVL